MADERLGLPSASGIGRVVDCPGSLSLEAKCPPSPPNKYSERGTRIHGVMDGSVAESDLTPEELSVAQELRDYDKVLLVDVINIVREQRYWHTVEGNKLWSGKLDVAGVCRVTGQGVCINYKTGRGQNNVRYNWQAKAESVLFWQQHRDSGMSEVRYCFSQPESPYDPILCHTFTELELQRAERDIQHAVMLALQTLKPPPLNPTESACQWCRAVSICPAFKHKADAYDAGPSSLLKDMSPSERGIALSKARDAATAAKMIYDSLTKQAKDLITDDKDSISGWYHANGRSLTRVTSTRDAMDIAIGLGVPEAELLKATKLSFSELSRMVGKHVPELPDLKSFMSDKFATVTKVSTANGSVKQRRSK